MPEAADAEKMEAGRRLFARPWDILITAATVEGLPAPSGVEIAFAGRSNVGKSSLLNALTGRRALARTSNTPGRTRDLNLFGSDAGIVIVDMPGYGYARAPKTEVARWTSLVFDFLRGRQSLRRVYLLIDARHGIKDNDREAFALLDKAAVSYQVILTKADKLSDAALATVIAETEAGIAKRPAAHPRVIATSSDSGLGIDVLRAEIAALS